MDSYGDTSSATRPISHRIPADVSREDLDFYPWVYPFLSFQDLLFYLYPVALEYEKDRELECIDSFMYSLENCIEDEALRLSVEDLEVLELGLKWIWTTGGTEFAPWCQCPSLKKAIGVKAYEDANDLDA